MNLSNSEALDEPVHASSSDRSLHIVKRMRRAFLSICRCGDAMFSPYRLTTEQYALMRAVQRQPGIRQSELTDQIFAEPNTITAMVTLLERRGILRRRPSPTDGRVRLLWLTAHGETVMKRLSDDWLPMRTMLREAFAGEAGDQALDILDRVYEMMQGERTRLLDRARPEDAVEPFIEALFSGNGDEEPPQSPPGKRKKAAAQPKEQKKQGSSSNG